VAGIRALIRKSRGFAAHHARVREDGVVMQGRFPGGDLGEASRIAADIPMHLRYCALRAPKGPVSKRWPKAILEGRTATILIGGTAAATDWDATAATQALLRGRGRNVSWFSLAPCRASPLEHATQIVTTLTRGGHEQCRLSRPPHFSATLSQAAAICRKIARSRSVLALSAQRKCSSAFL
jgi:hypothetical protein